MRQPLLAALLSPIAWQVGRPDLFDSYSAGVLLLQMAGESVPCIVCILDYASQSKPAQQTPGARQ